MFQTHVFRGLPFAIKSAVLATALLVGNSASAAATAGFSTTDGGNVTGARSFSASTYEQINTIIANAKLDDNGKKVTGGAYPVIITYTGNEDALISQVIRDHTVDSSGNCPKARWNDAYRYVEIKEFTKGVTIQGANGSSANFGIVINKSSNVIVRNMKIGALAGANNDADMIRIDSGVNVWIDHNELFAVNNECKGSPDGDLTFESAIDIKKSSQDITVSYNYIHDVKKVGLDGSSSSDIAGGRKITFHHNVYRNVNARLPLQRGGWIHVYNNLYDGITDSGINVRQAGYALIESNWFQNAKNPITCRYDSSNCGFWDLRNNNVRNPGDFATYNITWSSGGTIDATNWTTTQPFPISLPYSYSPVSAQCVKDKLEQFAGVGKNNAQLTSSACGGSTSSTPVSSSSSSRSSSSVAVSSSSSSSSSSAAVSSSAGSAPVLSGTGDYPSGFSKCADLNGTCSVESGDGWVAFGRKGKWVTKRVSVPGTIACTVAAFGSDPGGNPNKCSYKR
ncbi:pectate lyase family protein [Cellvibrio japonicus]|uniref:Pectate lyase III n=1 Tax=Cellvibrio japonicus (strain Ueda107) TaxID=498211 RepID=B3PCG0_CELJU|nr:pectate lyase [Cellvibrio japonicus]ACE86187.1 pectate lyase III [Cellvibrio japonicus Ueda107]QEI11864.1 pectate lyase [Cellvibrio japonicus]QEI15438.1 pectate lyase [Cellvibrio japonicus]QEI19017.1 pectate lyase [Cellvibrio japonicus]